VQDSQTYVADLEDLHSTFVHEQEAAFQVEDFDAVSAAGNQSALEFLSGPKGLSSFSLLARQTSELLLRPA